MSQPMISGGAGESTSISSEFMVGAVIFLFVIVVFIFFLYLYAKHFWAADSAVRRSRSRFMFAPEHGPLPRRGLHASLLQALPVSIFRSADFKEGIDCAVCLSDLSDGEEVRLLPKCNHTFHLECIDMWFHSHSTCPLCRSAVAPDPSDSVVVVDVSEDGNRSESHGDGDGDLPVPTNVLFWGTQNRVNTGRPTTAAAGLEEERPACSCSSSRSSGKPEGGMLMIEIPRRVVVVADGISPLPSSRFPVAEDMKTPTSATRLRSLRRMFSRGKRTIGSSSSPSPRPSPMGGGGGGDIEQGGGGVVMGGGEEGGSTPAPKTPTNW